MPSTPPLPSNADIPSTPPTSPQRYQQAARDQERNQHLIGSPEQRRTPANPSRPPSPPPVIVGGHELRHLPFDLRLQLANIPPHQPLPTRGRGRGRGRVPSQPFPFPPPLAPLPPPPLIASAVGSSSMAPPGLGSRFVPILPLLPPSPPLASSSQRTSSMGPAQLRALYVSLPNHPPVSCIFFLLLQ